MGLRVGVQLYGEGYVNIFRNIVSFMTYGGDKEGRGVDLALVCYAQSVRQ